MIDEFYCPGCKKSMIGGDGICMNCGHDSHCEPEDEFDDDYSEDDDREELDDERYAGDYDSDYED